MAPGQDNRFRRMPATGSEEQSFENCFRKYYAPLCLFANSYLHDEEQAKDLVQDCFIRFWETRQVEYGPTPTRSFLYTIVRNKCIDVLRKRKALAGPLEDFKYLAGQWSEEELCEVTRAETVQKIHDAIGSLPARMQRVFRMYYLEGKKYAEIAAALGIQYNTVRQQKDKALELLRSRLITISLLIVLAGITFLK